MKLCQLHRFYIFRSAGKKNKSVWVWKEVVVAYLARTLELFVTISSLSIKIFGLDKRLPRGSSVGSNSRNGPWFENCCQHCVL